MSPPPQGAKLLVIGSGPIVIGQAAEFDFSGSQACRSLKEEGYQTVLVNSNPATIQTDLSTADIVYVEPLDVETITEIIVKEKVYGILSGMGGQTALNLCSELADQGILDRLDVRLLGTQPEAIALSEDRELALACGPGAVDHFENSKIFRELVSRHQLALGGMKREGQDISAQEAILKSGLTSLGTRNYTAVAESFKEIQDSLTAMDRISHEREKLRGDTADALAKLLDAIDQLKLEAGTAASEEPLMKQLADLASGADESFQAGKFSDALGDIRRAEELAGSVRQARSGRAEIMMMVESITAQLVEARKLEVDTSTAESHLERARSLLRTGNLPTASDEAFEAAQALLAAKSESPKAIEAEFDRASRIIDSPTATESELRLAEDGLAGAIPAFLRNRDFDAVADSYERLAACWARRPASSSVWCSASRRPPRRWRSSA